MRSQPDEVRPLAADEPTRTIELGGRSVPYVLRRAGRGSIGLSIDHRGLRVGAPLRASLTEIEAVILRHREWVSRKLDEWQDRSLREIVRIADGTQLPLLGSPFTIRLALGTNRWVWNLQTAEPSLTLCLRSPAEAPRVLEEALRESARALFVERLAHYVPLLGVDPPVLSLSSARGRWGSCSRRSGIRLNWRLIHFPQALIDYVVVHELAHLHEMNHSPSHKAVMASVLPNWCDLQASLKKCGRVLDREFVWCDGDPRKILSRADEEARVPRVDRGPPQGAVSRA